MIRFSYHSSNDKAFYAHRPWIPRSHGRFPFYGRYNAKVFLNTSIFYRKTLSIAKHSLSQNTLNTVLPEHGFLQCFSLIHQLQGKESVFHRSHFSQE